MTMRRLKISRGGQVSVPAEVRERWQTSTVTAEDRGDHLVLRPAADDPIAALRGSLRDVAGLSTGALRRQAREDEAAAEHRRES